MSIEALAIGSSFDLKVMYRDTGLGLLQRQFGVGLPSLAIELAYGSGSGQANKAVLQKRTLTATTYDLLDLAGGLTDGVGNTVTFTSIKLALVAIVAPDGSKKVRTGPQNQSNPFVSYCGGSSAVTYKLVTHWDVVIWEPVAGYAVTAGSADIFPIYNPGASSLDYYILLAGV